MQSNEERQAEALAQGFLRGELSRREFFRRAGGFSVFALGATSLGAVLTACSSNGGSTTPSGSPSGAVGVLKPGGTLKAALTGGPDTLDPATSTIYTGAQVYDNIFNKLIDLDPDGNFYGQLATTWDSSDDTTWVFDLVDNAVFHNGEAFTADDVKYTFERFLSNIANNGEIVNQKAIESADPARNPVGTGPFQFVEWVQDDYVTLKKWDQYFQSGLPYLDGVEFRFLNVDQSRIDGLRSGELNWVDAVPLQDLDTLKTDPSFNYVTAPNAGIPDYLALNTQQTPFDDKLVRQAVYWALDRDAIRQVAYFGAGETGIEEVPTGSVWYDGAQIVTPDIAKATDLLAQAGHGDGLTVEYLGLPQYPELLKTGEVVREQLKQIGITMNIKQVDVSVWFNDFVKGNYQITSAYQERTIDPDNFYALVVRTGGDINTTGYSNPQADQLIDQARTSTDDNARKGLYQQLRQIVFDDAPIIFAHYETINYLMQKDVAGASVNPTLELRLQNVGFISQP
jgi:peptide/nickel transport system substrate-binding protein